jgi:hypothetical protein
MAVNEQKIARAAEVCLALMDASHGAPLEAELEYVNELEGDERWTDEEIRALQKWIKAAWPEA